MAEVVVAAAMGVVSDAAPVYCVRTCTAQPVPPAWVDRLPVDVSTLCRTTSITHWITSAADCTQATTPSVEVLCGSLGV